MASILVNWDQVVGTGPARYGVEYGWVDQAAKLFLERYRMLNPNLLRVQITQEYFELENDNDDPNLSEIDFGLTIPLDSEMGTSLTYQTMFTALAREFPQMEFQINIWLAARWNASDPNGYLGLGGTFPPVDYAEHREFIRELARWLVRDCGIEPGRLSFAFINEPNLGAFFTGDEGDLLRMALETRRALDAVSPEIGMAGLDEVHGAAWTDRFVGDPRRAASCCDLWTFHAYERGVDALWAVLQERIQHLSAYGPVMVTEFADTNNGSPDAEMDFSSEEAALGFAELAARLWTTQLDGLVHFRLADTYVQSQPLSGWAGHGLFADARGTHSSGEAFALFPSFWVFANLYNHFTAGQVVAVSGPPELVLMAVRRPDPPESLALWITNPSDEQVSAVIELSKFPAQPTHLQSVDNLTGERADHVIVSGVSAGNSEAAWSFQVAIPARSSFTFIVTAPDLSPTPTSPGSTLSKDPDLFLPVLP